MIVDHGDLVQWMMIMMTGKSVDDNGYEIWRFITHVFIKSLNKFHEL